MTRDEFKDYLFNQFPTIEKSDVTKSEAFYITDYYSIPQEGFNTLNIEAMFYIDMSEQSSESDGTNLQSVVITINTVDSEGNLTRTLIYLPLYNVEADQSFLENKLIDIYDILNN